MSKATDKKTTNKVTEAPSNFSNLEKMSVNELLCGINQEDGQVHLAVNKAIPQIEKFVSILIDRIKAGGRLFYLGAGTSGRLGVLDASELPHFWSTRKHRYRTNCRRRKGIAKCC